MTATNIPHRTPESNAKAFPLRASPEARRKAGDSVQLEFSVRMVVSDDEIVGRAREILSRRLRGVASVFDAPGTVRDYLTMQLAGLEHEVFGVLWLDARHALIDDESMFRGTLTQTSVYPREVVKSALLKNAAACILYHNHPSGAGAPSPADESLTRVLKEALALIDVRVLDHMIVAGAAKPTSFAECGLI